MTHPLNVPSPPFSPHNSLSCRHFTLSPLTPYPHLSPYRVGRAKLASPPYSPPSPPLTPLPYHPHSLSLSSPHLGGSHQASFRSALLPLRQVLQLHRRGHGQVGRWVGVLMHAAAALSTTSYPPSPLFYSFTPSLIHSFIHSFNHSPTHSLIYPMVLVMSCHVMSYHIMSLFMV